MERNDVTKSSFEKKKSFSFPLYNNICYNLEIIEHSHYMTEQFIYQFTRLLCKPSARICSNGDIPTSIPIFF